MAKFIDAQIAICKCSKSHQPYAVRFEKWAGDDLWHYNWAFKMRKETAARERYDETKLAGHLSREDEYPGCPYCGCNGFVICECGKLNCFNQTNNEFKCEWCGMEGILGEYDGSGFASGGDI
ncbi:MAG: hypothetical protein MSA77_02255 [Selenomonadales bacterium]|jgi:hypothetical protein|nr:hypothetical protein [Selenomonadales bacterium]MDY3739325.1 TerY-C metal binding domain-containing protein [Selenomonadaceae bacterium]MEE1362195.1 TerY-C metal binding domain-containing protein [Selenomonadaceae bacterium]